VVLFLLCPGVVSYNRQAMTFIPVETIDMVLQTALQAHAVT
jgi:hypothetical protein